MPVPFLDFRIIEMASALPTRVLFSGFRNKALLRRSIGGRLPASIRRARKWGFGVPWPSYFRLQPDLRAYIGNLPDHPLMKEVPVRKMMLRAVVDRFLHGDPQQDVLITQLLMMCVWWDVFFTDTTW